MSQLEEICTLCLQKNSSKIQTKASYTTIQRNQRLSQEIIT